MRVFKFTVRASAGATQHEVAVTVPTYEEANEVQRRAAYNAGVFGQGLRVPSQTTLRTALDNGKRGAALNAVAQKYFTDHLNETTSPAGVEPLDYNALQPPMTREQVKYLQSRGAVFINLPDFDAPAPTPEPTPEPNAQ